jgi:signal transduction histidine kinase
LADTRPSGTKGKTPETGIGTIVVPFVVWAAIAFMALAGLGYVTVTHLNELDRVSQSNLARTALMLERTRLATLASEYSWWDEAIKNLFPTPDPLWIRENIGLHAHRDLDIDLTVVIGRNDGIHTAYSDRRPATIDPEFVRHPDMQSLIGQARRSAMYPVTGTSGFALFKGQLHMFGVSPFSPEIPPQGAPPDLQRAVLIFGRRMDTDFLEIQATNFGLTGLRLAPPTVSSHETLHSPTGTDLAGLTWKDRAPGTALTTRLILPAAAVLAILGTLAWYFLARALAMSQTLATAADITKGQNHQLRTSEAAALRSQSMAEQASDEKDQALDALRERNEDLLAARHEAMQASQAKTMFLAAMSHELRTPLNAIIGFSEILRDQRFGPLGTDRYVDYADNIMTSGTHLLSLINDVLDISKIEAGKLTLVKEEVSVADLCASTLRFFQEQAHAGRVALSSSVNPETIVITADPRALRQILVNLLSNALKFTRPGDAIAVTVTLETSLKEGNNQEQVKIAVSDTGVGIPDEYHESVFLAFNRGAFNRGGSFSDTKSGTGLGLALVKSLTEMHGGHVQLRSSALHGTTVSIFLPLTAPRTDDNPPVGSLTS